MNKDLHDLGVVRYIYQSGEEQKVECNVNVTNKDKAATEQSIDKAVDSLVKKLSTKGLFNVNLNLEFKRGTLRLVSASDQAGALLPIDMKEIELTEIPQEPKITLKHRSMEANRLTLIDYFSRKKSGKVGPLDQLINLLNSIFEQVESWFSKITGLSEIKLKRDFKLLSSVVGQFPIEKTISLKESLSYIGKMLEKEEHELAPYIKAAEYKAKKIEEFRAAKMDRPTKTYKKFVKSIQSEVKTLQPGKKILLPLSYQEKKNWQEFCLEVEAQENGKCRVRVISNNPRLAEVFGGEGLAQFLLHTRDGVDREELVERLPALIAIQVWQDMGIENSRSLKTKLLAFGVKAAASIAARLLEKFGPKDKSVDEMVVGLKEAPKSKLNNIELFKSLLVFEGAVVIQPQGKKAPKALAGSLGSFGEMMTYVKHLRPSDYQRFETSAQLELFLQTTEGGKSWVQNEAFRAIALSAARKLLNDIEENKAKFFGLEKEHQTSELKKYVSRLEAIIQKVENYRPKNPRLGSKSFSSKLNGLVTYMPFVGLQKGVFKKGIVSTSKGVDLPPLSTIAKDEVLTMGKQVEILKEWSKRADALAKIGALDQLEQELIEISAKFPSINDPLWESIGVRNTAIYQQMKQEGREYVEARLPEIVLRLKPVIIERLQARIIETEKKKNDLFNQYNDMRLRWGQELNQKKKDKLAEQASSIRNDYEMQNWLLKEMQAKQSNLTKTDNPETLLSEFDYLNHTPFTDDYLLLGNTLAKPQTFLTTSNRGNYSLGDLLGWNEAETKVSLAPLYELRAAVVKDVYEPQRGELHKEIELKNSEIESFCIDLEKLCSHWMKASLRSLGSKHLRAESYLTFLTFSKHLARAASNYYDVSINGKRPDMESTFWNRIPIYEKMKLDFIYPEDQKRFMELKKFKGSNSHSYDLHFCRSEYQKEQKEIATIHPGLDFKKNKLLEAMEHVSIWGSALLLNPLNENERRILERLGQESSVTPTFKTPFFSKLEHFYIGSTVLICPWSLYGTTLVAARPEVKNYQRFSDQLYQQNYHLTNQGYWGTNWNNDPSDYLPDADHHNIYESFSGMQTANGVWTESEARDFFSLKAALQETIHEAYDRANKIILEEQRDTVAFEAVQKESAWARERVNQTFSKFAQHPNFWGRTECRRVMEQNLEAGWKLTPIQERLQIIQGMQEGIRILNRIGDVRGLISIYAIYDWIYVDAVKNESEEELELLEQLLGEGGGLPKLQELSSQYTQAKNQRDIHREVLASYYNRYRKDVKPLSEFSDVDVQLLLTACLKTNLYPPDIDNDDPAITWKGQQMIHLVLPILQQKPEKEILTFVQNLMKNGFKLNLEWKLAKDGFPGFAAQTADGHYHVLDLRTGMHAIDGSAATLIPVSVLQHPNIVKNFKFLAEMKTLVGTVEGRTDVNGVAKKCYTPAQYPDYQIVLDESGSNDSIQILRKIKDEKGNEIACLYVNTDELLSAKEVKKEKKVTYKDPMWEDEIEEPKERTLWTERPKESQDIRSFVRAGIGENICWRSLDDSNKIFVTDGKDSPYALLTLRDVDKKAPESGKQIDNWTLLSEQNISLLDTSKATDEFQFLAQIEREDRILSYGRRGRVVMTEFPKLLCLNGMPLRYRMSKDRIMLGSDPTYILKNESISGMPSVFKNYHLFENSRGEKKILVAQRELKPFKELSADMAGMQEMVFEDKENRIYEWDVDLETGLPKSDSVEGNLYLAYLFMSHQDYGKALEYVKKARPQTAPSKEYEEILQWIRKSADRSFGATVFRLAMETQLGKTLGQWIEPEEERQERLKNVKKTAMEFALHLEKNPNLATSGFYHQIDRDEVMQMVQECDATVQLTQAKGFVPAGNLNSKQPFVSEMIQDKLKQEEHPKLQIGPHTLQGFVVNLWTEATSDSKTLPYDYQDRFVLDPKGWLIKDFFVIVRALDKADKNSADFKELSNAIMRSHPFMEQDRLGLLLDKKAAIKRLRYLEARKYLLAIIHEKKSGTSDVATIFKTLEDKLAASSNRGKEINEKAVNKAYESDLNSLHLSTRKALSKAFISSLKSMRKPIEDLFTRYNAAFDEKQDSMQKGLVLDPEKEKEFNKLDVEVRKFTLHKNQIEVLIRIFSLPAGENEGRLKSSYRSVFSDWLETTQQELNQVNNSYNFLLKQRNALWAKNAALHPANEEQLKELKRDKERLTIQLNKIEEFIKAVDLKDADFEKFNEDFLQKYFGKDFKALKEASSKLVKLNHKLVKFQPGFEELPPEAPHIEESKETLLTKQIDEAFKRLPKISMANNLESQIESLQTKIEDSKPREKVVVANEGVEKPVFSLGNSVPTAVLQPIKAPDNLNRVFDFLQDSKQDPIVKKLGEAHHRDLKYYLSGKEVEVPVLTKDHVRAAGQKTAAFKLEKTKEKEQLKDSILASASKFVEHESLRSLKVRLGKELAPGFDRLLGLYLSGELLTPGKENALRKSGVDITETNLKILHDNIQKFLIVSTELQHAKRTLEVLEKAKNEFKKSKKLDETLNEELYQMLTAKRVYDPLINPYASEFLMIEYKNGFLMREEQKNTVVEMLEKPGAIRQLIMGGGKSKVLLPILAKRMADGQNLMMVVVPEPLFAINKKDLTATAKELFGQDVYVFDFNRQTPTDKEELLKIHLGLLQTMNDKGFIATTKANLLAYRHAYHELGLKFTESPSSELAECLKIMANTLDLMKRRGIILADEVDTILDVKKEVNYSVGDPRKLSEDKRVGAVQLMKYMLESDHLKNALKVDGQATLSAQTVQGELERVAGRFYEEEKISGWNKENFIAYMTGKDVEVEEGSHLPAPMLALKTNNPDLYKKIAIARQFISVGFAHSLQMSKSTTSGYGRDPEGGVWTIPSASGNISRNSQFDDEIERVCVTLQDYISGGISIRQSEQMVEKLKSAAKREMQEDVEGELTTDETEAGKLFKHNIEQINRFLPEDKQFSSSLQYFGHEQIVEFTKAISSYPELLLQYCDRFVLGDMEFAPLQLIGTPQDLVAMVNDFKGFTGTLWNAETFHASLDPQRAQGVDGKTYTLLLGRKKPNIIPIDLQAENPLSSLLGDKLNLVGNYHALIDLGGYLKGKKSEEFVEAFEKTLKKNPSSKLKGCVYVDSAKGEVTIKRRGEKGKPMPLSEARDIQPEERFTFYDQARTVGTDIVQGNVKAFVTIGENTYTRDLFQAVWRMRKLAAGQSVDLCISHNIVERIKTLCFTDEEKKKGVSIDIEHVLRFCLLNEALRCADDNFRSAVQKISSEIPLFLKEEAVRLGKNLDSADSDAYIQLFQNNLEAFVRERNQGEKLIDTYAAVAKMEDPVKVLKTMLTDEGLLKKHEDLLNTERYRLKVKKAETLGGNEVQAQVQAQAEVQAESQTLVLVETEVIASAIAPHGQRSIERHNLEPKHFDTHFDGTPNYTYQQRYMHNSSHYIHQLSSNKINALYPKIFDKSIQVSCNIHEENNHALTRNRRPVYEALFGRNNKGEMIAVMVALHDQKVACEYAETKDDVRFVRLGVDKNIFIRGDVDFPEEDKKDFLRLYVQCKLFSGQLSYQSPGEKEALLDWMQGVTIPGRKSGIAAVKECFENEILPSLKADQQEAYGRSQLRTLLNHESRLNEVVIALKNAPDLEGNKDAKEILGYFITKHRGKLEAVETAVRGILAGSPEEDITAIMAEAKRMLKK